MPPPPPPASPSGPVSQNAPRPTHSPRERRKAPGEAQAPQAGVTGAPRSHPSPPPSWLCGTPSSPSSPLSSQPPSPSSPASLSSPWLKGRSRPRGEHRARRTALAAPGAPRGGQQSPLRTGASRPRPASCPSGAAAGALHRPGGLGAAGIGPPTALPRLSAPGRGRAASRACPGPALRALPGRGEALTRLHVPPATRSQCPDPLWLTFPFIPALRRPLNPQNGPLPSHKMAPPRQAKGLRGARRH